MGMCKARPAKREIFATHVCPIENRNEFFRMTVHGDDGRKITIILTPTAYAELMRDIVSGEPPGVH